MGQSIQWQTDTLKWAGKDTLTLSQSFLVPFSDSLFSEAGAWMSPSSYKVLPDQGLLVLSTEAASQGTYYLRYRYFSEAPPQELALRTFTTVLDTSTQEVQVDVIYDPRLEQGQEVFWEDEGGIRKSGSLSRGLTLGNNRSPSLTSGLRLQLEGDLGDGLKVVGAITDENIPIQPDGTTQQISDFDRVFLKLMKDAYEVTIGDFEVSQKGSHFANYYRNVQGLQFQVKQKNTMVRVSGAVAKGKFHTNTIAGIDGVSGPYQLTGRNGERFFIVLAGSEKVYINGKLLIRGETNDYVINYNTAEITFTSQHVITNITRIVVDFEYNDRYFNRSLVVAEAKHQALDNKLKFHFSYARDADNPNAPFDNPDAFQLVRDSLGQVGDSLNQAVTSGIFNLGYEEGQTRYAERDTTIDGQTYVYYVRSNDPATAVYGIEFSFVGPGQGTYNPKPGFNENVFEWVPPGPSGESLGSYSPERRWVLPRLLQVADARVSYQLTKRLQLFSETAVSSDDQNRLSRKDDEDNLDFANRTGLRWEKVPVSDSLELSVEAYHQFIGESYTNLDRVYRAEYNRVWDLDPNEVRRDEQITAAKAKLSHLRGLEMEIEGGFRQTGAGRTANRQVVRLASYLPRMLQGNLTYTRIANDRQPENRYSEWNRYEGDVYWPWKTWRLGMEIWAEDRNLQRADSISQG
ncbi:MAG: hypothetical protein AAF399_21625, partial [Bacteroidota bacterium]